MESSLKNMNNLNPLFEFMVLPAYLDMSNGGGIAGAAIGAASPFVLMYLYSKLIKQPRMKLEYKNIINEMLPEELNEELKIVIKLYSTLLSKNKIHPRLKQKVQTTCAKKTVMYVVVQDKDHNLMEFEDFDMNYTGYIHYIDYNQYKNNSFQDHDYPFEFVVKGNVKPFKVEKINVDFTIKCFRK